MVHQWIDRHTRAVLTTLTCCGVPERDRPDLAQEVFFTAYSALLRSEQVFVEAPRAWLCEVARRKANNYRRKPGRCLESVPTEEAASALADPEQRTEQREIMDLLDQLGADEQGVLVDVRVEGLTWDEVAQERGLTVPRAKYLYRVAVHRMEEACRAAAPATRRSFVLAIGLEKTFGALRAETHGASVAQEWIRASVEAWMGAPAPTPGPVNGAGPAPVSIEIYAPSASVGTAPVLGVLGGALAAGLLMGWLLHGPSASEPIAALRSAAVPIPTLATDEPPAGIVEARFAALDLASPAAPPRAPEVPARAAPGRADGGQRPAVSKRPRGPLALLDQALAAVNAHDPWTALAAVEEHARRFPRGPGAAERPHLWRVACALPAARGAQACAGLPPEPPAL